MSHDHKENVVSVLQTENIKHHNEADISTEAHIESHMMKTGNVGRVNVVIGNKKEKRPQEQLKHTYNAKMKKVKEINKVNNTYFVQNFTHIARNGKHDNYAIQQSTYKANQSTNTMNKTNDHQKTSQIKPELKLNQTNDTNLVLIYESLDIVIDLDLINGTPSSILKALSKVAFSKPVKIKTFNNFWQIVNGKTENYIMSAYYDDRPTLTKKYIRIIGIFEVPWVTMACLLWYRDSYEPVLSSAAKIKVGVRYPRHWKYFDPSIVTCAMPTKGCIPEYVSLINVISPRPTTLMKIQVPEKPLKDKIIDFGVCVSVSYWRHNPYRLVEWLELQKIFGAGEVTIYNNSLSDETVQVLQLYIREGFVDFRQAPHSMPDNGEITILMNMSPVINDCMYRNLYRYRKVVCIDIDEIIVPRKHWTYKTMLDAFDYEEPRNHQYKTYMFRNVYFFMDLPPVHHEPSFLVTPRYLRKVDPSPFGYAVKSITDPMVCIGLQNHVCWHVVEKYKTPDWLREVFPRLGMNQHYKKCHLDSNECQKLMNNVSLDNTMIRFEKLLEHKTSAVLLKLGLL